METYPDWQARDNYRKGLKEKKKKREKYDGIKKCRARYGIEHPDAWCKPCKRKKKCIRAQSYNETNIARVGQPGQPAGPSGNNHGCESMGSSTHDMFNHASKSHLDGEEDNKSYNETNVAGVGQPGQPASPSGNNHGCESMGSSTHDMFNHTSEPHLDDEEDNINDFDDNDYSPDSTSLGSTFEQSLTSPSEFRSLGSSASSIASLSTRWLDAVDYSPDSSLGSNSRFSSLNSLGSSASTTSSSTPQTFEAIGDFLRNSVTM